MKNTNKNKKAIINPEQYFEDGEFIPTLLEEKIENDYDIIYVNNIGFHIFENYWKKIDDNEIKKLIKNQLSYKAKPYYISNVTDLIKIEKSITADKINLNRNKIVLLNGTLDISDWNTPIFYEHQFFKEDYCTIQLNVKYNKDAKCPRFNKFLSEIFEDDLERIKIIQEMLGYILTPSTKLEKVFLFYGHGANGKSKILNLIDNLLTDINISEIGLNDFDKAFSRSSLYNKLVNKSAELESLVHDTGYLKRIASGDKIDAQFKFKDSFEFHPFCKLVFSMNNLPQFGNTDRSNGLYRRFIIMPFEVTIPEEKQDRNLDEKFKNELDGIFQFALMGLKRLYENNMFTRSEKCEKILKQYELDNNPVEQFLLECVSKDESSYIVCNKLYDKYKSFCKNNRHKELNNVHFGREILKKYPDSKKQITINNKREYVYTGIKFA
jgi:putative DNA primase/helicase